MKKSNLYLIGLISVLLACSPKREPSQPSFIPPTQVSSLIKYYEEDQLDSIVHIYQNFKKNNYSLAEISDTVQFRIWAAFGFGLKRTGNYEEAFLSYQKALDLADQIYGNRHTKYGSIANNLANIASDQGQHQEAIYFYQQALRVDQSDAKRGNKYNNLGALYRGLQQYDSSIYYYQKAIQLLPESSQYYPENNLGNVYTDLKEWKQARVHLKNALELAKSHFLEDPKQRYLIASIYNSLAYTYLANRDYPQTLQLIEKALAIGHEDTKTQLRSQIYQIESLYELAQFEEALSIAKKADSLLMQRQRSLLNQKDKLFFVSRSQEFAEFGFKLGLALDDLGIAFYFSERSKGAVLQELSAKSQSELPLRAYQTVSIENIQKKLKQDHALIEYKFTSDSLYAFVITQEDTQLMPVATAQADSAAKVFVQSITGGLVKDYIKIAPRTYKTIFAPVESVLDGKRKLIIIPDGSLNYLPWEALLRKYPANKETWLEDYYSKLSFLIRDYTISYHSSASLAMMSSDDHTDFKKELIGFFPNRFPFLAGTSFDKLPYTQSLARILSNKIPNSKIYTGQAAKESFQEIIQAKEKTRVLHIDSHGFVNESNPDSSAIVLRDSLLYLSEILELDVSRFDLLALVTCSSGEGVYVPGEGVISLARGFIVAGGKNIIHSLWLANDEASADLFESFYEFLSQGETYSEALRLAKLREIAKPGGHPTFWANFVLFENLAIP